MYWHVNTFVTLFFQNALATPIDTGLEESSYFQANKSLKVYRRQSYKSALRGLIHRGDVFEVYGISYRESCPSGWADVGEDAYLCLGKSQAVDVEPHPLPLLLNIAPPSPEEWENYVENLTWNALEGEYFAPFTPLYHGRRTDDFGGWLYASAEEYEEGARPKWRLEEGRDYRFKDVISTKSGAVLERPDGKVAPLDEIAIYPVSRFSGRDMSLDPVPKGQTPAYAINREGAPIRIAPANDAMTIWSAEHREPLNLSKEPVGDWWIVPDALGSNKPGYIHNDNIRHWQASSPPEELSEQGIWIDVDLSQQMLAIYEGEVLQYITLISSAREGYKTFTGLYRIYDKATAWDLGSKQNASDPYYIEQVPWVMHYYPRYAIHSAFWHDDFGHPASHGCINMSPIDAKIVFDSVSPELPDGWRAVFQTPSEYGTLLRIRKNLEPVPRKIRN